ncbi:MAG: hypothetical protein IPK58_15505 [Acidobacteria bacterium]|nr:hypothetical protein [Acidobacteriota bacterium]
MRTKTVRIISSKELGRVVTAEEIERSARRRSSFARLRRLLLAVRSADKDSSRSPGRLARSAARTTAAGITFATPNGPSTSSAVMAKPRDSSATKVLRATAAE